MNTHKKTIAKKFRNIFYKSFFSVLTIVLLCSHDLYLKMGTYFLQPNQEATISLYNGTFEKSENIITRDRMLDASVVTHGKRTAINSNQWQDQDSTITKLPFTTGKAGTYVVGVSTKARNIEMTADKFNDYLKHDGVLDMLEYRTKNNLLDQNTVESYQKHVKAMYQVGDVKTDDWKTVLGYPIEFVPQANPYEKHSGETLDVQLLLDGKPLANQLVYANYIQNGHAHAHNEDTHTHDGTTHTHKNEHTHADETHKHTHDSQSKEAHTHTDGQQLRTDAQGTVTVQFPEEGIYYIRTIHMENVTDSDELTHRSKWATLTFEVTHKHDSSTHTHAHEHEAEDGLPMWVFIVGSLLIIGLLFLVFRKKN